MRQTSPRSIGLSESRPVLPIRGAERRPLMIVFDAGSLDVFVEICFQLVMAGHFIDLAVFLVKA
jgi:hypothetical protein